MSPIYLSVFLSFLGFEVICHGIEKRQVPSVQTNRHFNQRQTVASKSNINSQLSSVDNTVSNSIQNLAFNLTKEQSKVSDGNVIFSPLSIGALLSLIMLGTSGNTKTELRNALSYSTRSDEVIHNSYQSIIENLNRGIPGVEVKMTNQLFIKTDSLIFANFINKAKLHYKTGIQSADFERNPVGVVRDVNNYVSRATDGKITNLIKQPFSPFAVFVAVNTILFNGNWENPFSKIHTYNGTFSTGIHTIDIPMMIGEGTDIKFLGGDSYGFNMIALPYKGNIFSMYILTPIGGITIKDLETEIDTIIIKRLIREMVPQKVIYTIPRMQIRKSLKLKSYLKKLDIVSIFNTHRANFQEMTSTPNVYLEEVIHEAVLEITESGTVAAAATAGTSDRILPKTFIFDRPSLLFIRDDTNGVILFWAKVVEPTPFYK